MNMTKIFAAAVSFVALSSAAFAADQDFTLKNRTGYDIKEVYVSRPSAKSWGNDILGDGILSNGGAKKVRFKPTTEACKWQLQVIFSDGEAVEWDAFDLCKVHTITLHYENNQATAEEE
ncbi:conserved exported hypothetical protein [Candidatus Terasakiella magnetica]|nr:conserved exported hypothetical protein [Candidatus Terasakiella magnetica]